MEQNRLYGAGVGKRGIIALHIIGGGCSYLQTFIALF